MASSLDIFSGFFAQLECRDKYAKVFQNWFRAIAGLPDEWFADHDHARDFLAVLPFRYLLARGLFQSRREQSSSSSSAGEKMITSSIGIGKLQAARLSRAFEDARVMFWLGKWVADFRSIYKQVFGIGKGACGTLINGNSVWTDDPHVKFFLMLSRLVMATRWILENTRVYFRARDFARGEFVRRWGEVRQQEKGAVADQGKKGANKQSSGGGAGALPFGMVPRDPQGPTEEHEINVVAKKLWVLNVSFGFLAELIRLVKFALLASKSSYSGRLLPSAAVAGGSSGGRPLAVSPASVLGGSVRASLLALVFYFLDGHAAINLAGWARHSETRIGVCMTLASVIQLYNMHPTAEKAYVRQAATG